MRTDYFQKRTSSVQFIQPNNGGAGSNEPQINPAGAGNARDYGDNHRVEFGAWFFF